MSAGREQIIERGHREHSDELKRSIAAIAAATTAAEREFQLRGLRVPVLVILGTLPTDDDSTISLAMTNAISEADAVAIIADGLLRCQRPGERIRYTQKPTEQKPERN